MQVRCWTKSMGMATREKHRPCRGTRRNTAKSMAKDDTTRRQTIECRRLDDRISQGTGMRPSPVIGHEDQDVGTRLADSFRRARTPGNNAINDHTMIRQIRLISDGPCRGQTFRTIIAGQESLPKQACGPSTSTATPDMPDTKSGGVYRARRP